MRTAFQYAVARNKRYRLLEDGNEENEYVPTLDDLVKLKNLMYDASSKFKLALQEENQDDSESKRDKTVEMLKQQVLDLNDKFDYFVCMMLKAKSMPVENMVNDDVKASHITVDGPDRERREILDKFK